MMHDRRNDYLRRRQDRRRYGRERDYRNPYGSKGGYVDSRRGSDYAMDSRNYDSEHNRGGVGRGDIYNRDSRNDYHYEQYRESRRPHEFEVYGIGGMRPKDYERDYRRDMNYSHNDYNMDYASEHMEKEYEEELDEWIEKLKTCLFQAPVHLCPF